MDTPVAVLIEFTNREGLKSDTDNFRMSLARLDTPPRFPIKIANCHELIRVAIEDVVENGIWAEQYNLIVINELCEHVSITIRDTPVVGKLHTLVPVRPKPPAVQMLSTNYTTPPTPPDLSRSAIAVMSALACASPRSLAPAIAKFNGVNTNETIKKLVGPLFKPLYDVTEIEALNAKNILFAIIENHRYYQQVYEVNGVDEDPGSTEVVSVSTLWEFG